MYDQLLESSEFYQKRYHSFASKIILPTFGLFLFLLLFLVFMTKEITLKTSATVEPSHVLTQIQSTSNNKIKTNNLKDNQVVKVGELLVEYDSFSESIHEEITTEQLEQLNQQRLQLELLKTSFEQGISQFSEPDRFGYSQRFDDYLSQQETISSHVSQQNSNIANQNASSAHTQGAIWAMIENVSQKITDYQYLRSVIEHDGTLDSSNIGYAFFNVYNNQLNLMEEETDKNNLKLQTLSQIDSQIQQFNTELATYHIQYSGSGTQQAYNSSLESQLASLRSQKIAEVSQELTILDLKISETEGSAKLQKTNIAHTKITATEDGIVHLNKEVSDAQIIPTGTVIASIYPLLKDERKVSIEAYISSRDISSLAVGDKIHFKTQDSSNKEIILQSKISHIDINATKTEAGNFFKIRAETAISNKQIDTLKYGMEGHLVIITGEKTYLNYYLEKFLK